MIAKVSASQEDYLEVIYDLSHGLEPIRSIDIANCLGVSRASVNKRLCLLKDSGFVEHEPYGLVHLTESGLAVAKNVRQRHNTLYKFLTDILGVNDEVASKEACEMEHAISQDTADKLFAYLSKLDKAPTPEDKISKTQRIQASYNRIINEQ
ncbi:MAG: metal-dependent transcriptional regulator [Treponema sp.]|uniref:metal-dependent transcriptional regulator n=1 Tax=Treponema sp. TaxID=166 RepID=UPI003FA1A8A6